MNAYSKFIDHLKQNPKKLFLIDGIGAFITVMMLLLLFDRFNEHFSFPSQIIPYLSLMGTSLFIFSTLCYLFLKNKWSTYISTVAFGNLLYCIVTLGLLALYFDQFSKIGTLYFLIETIIVGLLVYIELKVAATLKIEDQQ